MKNQLTVRIFNKDYRLVTDETKEYTDKIANELNKRMSELINAKTMMSHQDIAALIALETYDQLVKAQESVENIRAQLKAYADEAQSQRVQAEKASATIQELREKVAQLEKEVKLRTKLSSDKNSANDMISHDIQKVLHGSNVPYNAMNNDKRNLK